MQVGPYTFPPLHINLDSLSNTWFLQVVTFKSSGWVGVQSYLHNSADPQNTLPLHYSASPPSYFEHNFRQHIISPLNTIAASPKNDSKITAKLLSSYININYLHTVLKYMCSVQIFPTAKKKWKNLYGFSSLFDTPTFSLYYSFLVCAGLLFGFVFVCKSLLKMPDCLFYRISSSQIL